MYWSPVTICHDFDSGSEGLLADLPDVEFLEWVEGVVGHCAVVSAVAHDHGYSRLWRIAAGSDYVWLKMHAYAHKWAGEVQALANWRGPLMPELLAHREGPEAVLLSEMPGVDAEQIEFAPAAEAKLWGEAGAWLRDFHGRTNSWFGEVRPDGSPGHRTTMDPTELIRQGFANRLRDGVDRGDLDAREVAFARRRFEAGLDSLEGATAHSIHRDFHPRNWRAYPDGRLAAVIDFEHARWDVRAADLNRPWDKEFHRNPLLVDAFYEAYGRPDERFMVQIQTMRLYHVVTGLVWGREVGETAFSDFNRVALRRMMEGESGI